MFSRSCVIERVVRLVWRYISTSGSGSLICDRDDLLGPCLPGLKDKGALVLAFEPESSLGELRQFSYIWILASGLDGFVLE